MAEKEDKSKEVADKSEKGRPRRILPGQQRPQLGAANAKGRRRVQPQSPVGRALRKSALKKALPYLIAGGSTGLGLGIEFTDLII